MFAHYLQLMDSTCTDKAVAKSVLTALVEFLDRHGVDTSDLAEERSTILNNIQNDGVIVQGDLRADTLAVGHGAKATRNIRERVHSVAATVAAKTA